MMSGETLLQAGKPEEAYAIFCQLADSTTDKELKARANQMAGVAARSFGNLNVSHTRLIMAYYIATSIRHTLLRATILRDLGATEEALLIVSSLTAYLRDARGRYAKSIELLEWLVDQRRGMPFSDHDYLLASELLVSRGFAAFFAWRTTDKGPERDQARTQLLDSYDELKALNAKLKVELDEGYTALEPYEVYQTNALMRVLRASPLRERMRLRTELWSLTDASSKSSGRRIHGIVALVAGNGVYSWFLRRRMSA